MICDKHGQMIFNDQDLMDLIMQGRDITEFKGMIVDQSVDFSAASDILERIPQYIKYDTVLDLISTEDFDNLCQEQWHMPDEYKNLDIAEYILGLCKTDVELQRCGQELLLYQERDLFDLLRYLKYLVDTMRANNCIWGVGRGSSTASYVLYLLGVHRIDSLYYELDITEFLR